MAINIDKQLLNVQINELSNFLESEEYPEEHVFWGVLYLLEALYEEHRYNA